jgi:aminoglycoside phosphotransferase (APT) family kinase protein
MDRLIAFLPDSLPPEGPTRIVHGDFRLDNMILAPDAARVRAVLDWELSTLGDPMADFSYLLIGWAIPASLRNGLAGADLKDLGIPSVEETVERYAAKTGTASASKTATKSAAPKKTTSKADADAPKAKAAAPKKPRATKKDE